MSPTAGLLQHASRLLPVLEPRAALPWRLAALSAVPAGLSPVDPGGARRHAAAAGLAGPLLPLPAGDLRAHGLPVVPRAHVGAGPQPGAGAPRLEGPRAAPRQRRQGRLALLTARAPLPLARGFGAAPCLCRGGGLFSSFLFHFLTCCALTASGVVEYACFREAPSTPRAQLTDLVLSLNRHAVQYISVQ